MKKSKRMPGSKYWVDYYGEYEKSWYDIMLTSGQVFIRCYPNAGTFHHEETGEVVDGSLVSKFKLSERQWE